MCASDAPPPRGRHAGASAAPDPAQSAGTLAKTCAALLDQCAGEADLASLPDGMLQRLLAVAVGAYAARLEAGTPCEPFAPGSGLTASEVGPVVARMLRAVDVDLFELAMWQHLID